MVLKVGSAWHPVVFSLLLLAFVILNSQGLHLIIFVLIKCTILNHSYFAYSLKAVNNPEEKGTL